MNDQYYTADPRSASRPREFTLERGGKRLVFVTDAGVFSKGELDQGTRILLDALPPLSGSVLDLGCGWGAVGVILASGDPALRVTMADVNRRALALAEENARRNGVGSQCTAVESDGFSALGDRCFDAVVTNPPIRHPDQHFSETPAFMSDGALGWSGFAGNHLAVDPERGVFEFYLGSRVMNRLSVLIPRE